MTDATPATPAPTSLETPRRKGCRRWLLGCLVVPSVLVLVLVLALTAVESVRSGRIVPFPEVAGTQVWSAEGLPGRTVGGWRTPETVVHVAGSGLTAFDTDSGEEVWRLETDGVVCGTSEAVRDGLGVVLLEGVTEDPSPAGSEDEPELSCDVALAVDTGTGEEAWRTGPLFDGGAEQAEHLFPDGSHAEPVGDQVLVRVGGEMLGFDRDSGEELWRRDGFGAGGVSCPAADFLTRSATEVVVAGDCGIDEPVTVHVTDPATGEDVSAFAFPRGLSQPNMDSVRKTRLVAAEPIHVRVDLAHTYGPGNGYDPDDDTQGVSNTQVLAFDDDGTLRNTLDIDRTFDDDSSRDREFVVADDRIYTTTTNTSCTDDILAHDLSTGEELWVTSLPGVGHQVVGVRDGRLLVMVGGTAGYGECSMLTPNRSWQLYTLDTGSGDEEPLSPQLGHVPTPSATGLWWEDDRVIMLRRQLRDDSGGVLALR